MAVQREWLVRFAIPLTIAVMAAGSLAGCGGGGGGGDGGGAGSPPVADAPADAGAGAPLPAEANSSMASFYGWMRGWVTRKGDDDAPLSMGSSKLPVDDDLEASAL